MRPTDRPAARTFARTVTFTRTAARLARRAGCAAGFLAALTLPAAADAIDGHWCSPAGKHMFIAGPAITTPGGTQMQGNYSRHAFAYVAPAGEDSAGTTILMRLLNEMEVMVTTASSVPIIWHRCNAETS
ncbi:MAG: hypothetical protein P4L82_07380 [Ancalomicrobiaceae bacterium]|nr:hypothetical protein [Ancalomicrobiaceae bacterium]